MIDASSAQRGSALVETTVLMGVLIPLVFGVVMIGKLIDLKQTSEQAGRYAAWEATVYPQDSIGGNRPAALSERFFARQDNAISSRSREAGSNALWGESTTRTDSGWAARTGIAIDESSTDSAYDRHGVGSSTVAMQVGEVAGKSGTVLDGLRGNSWGLENESLVRASVGVQLKSNDWLQPNEGGGCAGSGNFACLQSQSVILADGWSSSNDEQARQRVRSLVPASALQPLGDIISNVGHLPMFKELRQLDGAFGHVDMGVLPEYAR